MSFTSVVFALFFAVLIALYQLLPLRYRKSLLLAAGLYFYAYWDWRFLGLMMTCIGADFFLALQIERAKGRETKRRYLVVSLLLNFGLLGFFKYYNFFATSASAALGGLGVHLPHLTIILPIGISFFTFESMSYTFDVYRGTLVPCRRIIDFALFIAFFPRLVAGPIIRASHFLPQLKRPLTLRWSDVQAGWFILLSGLIKKMVLADNLAVFVDPVFQAPHLYNSLTNWLAVVSYALQLYYDFSGYSDMAVGLAKVFGFDLPINFSAPYGAASLTDFWRRWHISLSRWLRDYVYIPLGGSRAGTPRTYLNLMLTMLLGGLWHGASWNFVAWGGLHGLGLAVRKASTAVVATRSPSTHFVGTRTLPRPLAHAITLLFVVLLWVPFRARDWATTVAMFHQLLWPSPGVFWIYPWLLPALLLCAGTAAQHRAGESDFIRFRPVHFWGRLQVALALLSLIYLTSVGRSPFIYFQF
jgi:alginate O-acetyltransferase complex protein AlgI